MQTLPKICGGRAELVPIQNSETSPPASVSTPHNKQEGPFASQGTSHLGVGRDLQSAQQNGVSSVQKEIIKSLLLMPLLNTA